MLKIKLALILLLFLFASAINAHEDHKKKKPVRKPDTLTIVGGDTIAINGIPTEKFMEAQHSEATEEYMDNLED